MKIKRIEQPPIISFDWPYMAWCLFVILLAVAFNPWWLLLLAVRLS